jgi:branched-chain amino acid transport system substrate-binding protein
MREQAIKVGVIADQIGPLSFVGIANANVATLVINDINAKGGLPAPVQPREQRKS